MGSAKPISTPLGCKNAATPANVPPDPHAQIKPSIFLSVCRHISGPVVSM